MTKLAGSNYSPPRTGRSVEPGEDRVQLAVHLGLMALLVADLGLVSNFRISSDWISLGSYLGLTGT